MLDKKALSQEQISVPAFRASFINETIRNNRGIRQFTGTATFGRWSGNAEYSDSDLTFLTMFVQT